MIGFLSIVTWLKFFNSNQIYCTQTCKQMPHPAAVLLSVGQLSTKQTKLLQLKDSARQTTLTVQDLGLRL